MAQITPDQALIASHDPHDGANNAFVARVMAAIPRRPANTFAHWRHMHRLAFAVITIAALALISSTAYAAYQLWLKPKIEVQHFGQNQYGRDEALVAFQHCGQSAAHTYEVKSSAQLTAEQVGQLLQAKCEMEAINTWAGTKEPSTLQSLTELYPGAFTVKNISGDTYELHGSREDRTVTVTKDTVFIVHGVPVNRDAIHVSDTVGYVEHDTYNQGGGWPTARKPVAIVALELPAEMYETDLQNQVATRQDCYGNSGESCVNSGLIDVYPRNGENNSAQTEPGDHFVIQGRIVEHNGATVKIKASSGALYTITAPLDLITDFNNHYSQNYSGTNIGIGDMLMVDYTQPTNADHKVIRPDQLQSVALMIEVVNKQDPIKKY